MASPAKRGRWREMLEDATKCHEKGHVSPAHLTVGGVEAAKQKMYEAETKRSIAKARAEKEPKSADNKEWGSW